MSKTKLKAAAGFTLIELLVVMLILAILAIGMLPVFKENICKAQYSADAVPAIANLRTKIGLYQYDHGKLPANPDEGQVSSWEFKSDDSEQYVVAQYSVENGVTTAPTYNNDDKMTASGKTALGDTEKKKHFGDTTKLDIGYDDLKGKRSLPIEYVYYNIPVLDETGSPSKKDSAYVVGCFGSGESLAAGTGYAVCEFNFVSVGKKYIGTFERYKAKSKDGETSLCPYLYLMDNPVGAGEEVSGIYVHCPKQIPAAQLTADSTNGDRPTIVTTMEANGWKFSN